MSGLTLADVGERAGIPRAVVQRYFNEHDHEYYPGMHRIPDLCAALGNNILVDWLRENTSELEGDSDFTSTAEVLRQLSKLTKEVGDVAAAVDEGIYDDKLSRDEVRRITGEAADVERQARRMREGLQHIAGNDKYEELG